MKRLGWALPTLFLLAAFALAKTDPPRFDQQMYLDELDRWTAIVQAAREGRTDAIPRDLPAEWIVSVHGIEYHVPTSFLARDLTKPDEADRVLERLKYLRESAVQSADTSATQNARDTASRILTRREYRRVRMPGDEESWRDRFDAWFAKVLNKIFGKAVEHVADLRVISDLIVWGLLLAAIAALLFWLRRSLLDAAQAEMHIGGAPSEYVSARPMEEWLAEARAAAGRGEYRVAVRLAYWGAISGMERAGAWKPDRARTPREYLRLTRGSRYESALRPLTREFERLWYAKQTASEADFLACMARVEELGRAQEMAGA